MRRNLMGAGILIAGLVGLISFVATILATGSITPTSQVYVSSQGISIGSLVSPGEVHLQRIALPAASVYLYFGPNDGPNLIGKQAIRDIPPGMLLSRDAVSDPQQSGQIAVPISFAFAPVLQPGDKVDIFVLGDEVNARGVIPLMQNVTLLPATTGSTAATTTFVVMTPPDRVTAMIYASTYMHLAAVLVVPGTKSTSMQPIFNSTDAERILGQ